MAVESAYITAYLNTTIMHSIDNMTLYNMNVLIQYNNTIILYAHSVNCPALRFDYLSDGIVAQATWSGAQRQRR